MANIYDINADLQQPDVVGNFNQGQQTAQQNQVFGEKQDAYQQALADQQTLRTLAPQVQNGDPNAFSQAAAIDPQEAAAQQGAGDGQFRRLQGAMNYIDQQTTPQGKEAAYQQTKPFFASAGKTPPATYAEAQPILDALKGHIATLGPQAKSDYINVGAGGAVFDPRTGKPIYTNPGVEPSQQLVNVPDGNGGTVQKLFQPRGATFADPNYGGAPSAAPTGSGFQTSISAASPVNGIAALQATHLVAQGMPPEQAMQQVVSDHPNQQFQIAFDPVSKTFKDVSDGSAQSVASPQGSGSSQPGQLGYTPPKEADSSVGKRLKDLQDMQTNGITVSPAQHDAYLTTGKFPEDADKPLSNAEESEAQSLATYKLPLSPYMLSKPAMQSLIQRALQINPNFNAQQYGINQKALNDYASNSPTSSGGVVTAANTSLGHLTDMADISKKLPSSYGMVNAGENAISNVFNTDNAKSLKAWNTAKNFLAGEVAKMVKGGVASESETKQMLDSLNPNDPNRDVALATFAKFMKDKTDAMEEKRNDILGAASPNSSLLNKTSQQRAARLIALDPNNAIPQFADPGSLSTPGQGQPNPPPAATGGGWSIQKVQ